MRYTTLGKFEIAKQQLFLAIELYLDGGQLVSAITLAGASEEILGKLVKQEGKLNALDQKVVSLCKMCELVFKVPADPRKFIDLRNDARNQLKHIGDGEVVQIDLEGETVKLLKRAIKNYKIIMPGYCALFRKFEKEYLRRYELEAKSA